MWTCPSCGGEVNPGAASCPHCGVAFVTPDTAAEAPSQADQPAARPATRSRRSRRPGATDATGAETPSTGPAEATPTHRWSWKRFGLVALTAALMIAALGGGGAALGWKLANDQQAAREPEPLPSVIQVPQGNYDGTAQLELHMPDVRGLERATAEQVLADAGIDVATVAVEETPWAGAPGQVVGQQPVAGTENPTALTLTISRAATVPEPAGRAATDIGQELGALGAEVIYQPEYHAGTPGGTALAMDPAPGEPLPAQVTITVAEAASSVMLATVDSLGSGCSSGSLELAGVSYPSSLSCTAYSEPRDNEWLLSKVVDSIEGTVGIPDTAATREEARVEVLADGRPVAKVTVSYGNPATFKATVSDALRLNIRVTSMTIEEGSAEVGLGDLKLVGGIDALKKLGTP